ncbi:MAG: glycosyl transferase [Candidatus Melainabacteria bacterium]|nr:MAG: glycosyl transferase [Candidatus Melainabacteria bacterium]
MSKYYFFSGPQSGNVNPTLAIAQGLVERGNQVVYYLTEEYRDVIESTGATFRSYNSVLKSSIGKPQSDTQSNRDLQVSAPWINSNLVKECSIVVPNVLQDLNTEAKPDAIIYGQMALWGRMLAQILQIPAVLLRPTFASNEHFNLLETLHKMFYTAEQRQERTLTFAKANKEMHELCEHYAIEPFPVTDAMDYGEPLTLVTQPRSFQYEGTTFDKRFHFVGPCILPRPDFSHFPLEQIESKPTLYISLGTAFNGNSEFYNMCFKAFSDTKWQVVQSIGNRLKLEQLDPVPNNFIVSPYVPQLDVLKRSDIFVTHGGMNSVMEGLSNGVPLVVVPQSGEQMLSAQRVEQLGIGLALHPRDVTVSSLRKAVEQISSQSSYRERASSLQEDIQRAGGYQTAVDAITTYTKNRKLPGYSIL